MIETTKYVRKPFNIDAVQVNEQNMQAIAVWCSGTVVTDAKQTYIKVGVNRPMSERQTKAYVGDWVLFSGTGFKVYTARAFAGAFEQVSVETVVHEGPAVIQEARPRRAPRKQVTVATEELRVTNEPVVTTNTGLTQAEVAFKAPVEVQ